MSTHYKSPEFKYFMLPTTIKHILYILGWLVGLPPGRFVMRLRAMVEIHHYIHQQSRYILVFISIAALVGIISE
jgi:hypothetical protein